MLDWNNALWLVKIALWLGKANQSSLFVRSIAKLPFIKFVYDKVDHKGNVKLLSVAKRKYRFINIKLEILNSWAYCFRKPILC